MFSKTSRSPGHSPASGILRTRTSFVVQRLPQSVQSCTEAARAAKWRRCGRFIPMIWQDNSGVHSTVHNAVVLPAVVLAVHGGGQVITAFGGVKRPISTVRWTQLLTSRSASARSLAGDSVSVKSSPSKYGTASLGRIPVPADAGRRSAQFQRTVPAAWPALFAD